MHMQEAKESRAPGVVMPTEVGQTTSPCWLAFLGAELGEPGWDTNTHTYLTPRLIKLAREKAQLISTVLTPVPRP